MQTMVKPRVSANKYPVTLFIEASLENAGFSGDLMWNIFQAKDYIFSLLCTCIFDYA